MNDILGYLQMHGDEMLADLRRLVECESPTGDRRRLDSLAADLAAWTADMTGGRAKVLESPAGNHVLLEAGSPERGHTLLLFHFDTVWPAGTLAGMPFEVKNHRATGPGVFDMKAGIVQGVWALRALCEVFGDPPPVVCLFTSDEETGSFTSRELIEAAAQHASAALVLEPSQDGLLKTSRKGVGLFRIEVTGIPAHAGVEPNAGASAITELALQVLDLHSENSPSSATTLNIGVVGGGTRPNVVAAHAWADVDLRVTTNEEAERMTSRLLGLRPHDPQTRVEVTGGMNRPPMERTQETALLYAQARDLAAGLGFELGETSSGGGSDGNFCAAVGIPVLDGLGAVGGGAHARDEHILIEQMAPRAALVAHLLREFDRK